MQRCALSGVVQKERICVGTSRRTDGEIGNSQGVCETGRSGGIQGDRYRCGRSGIGDVTGISGSRRTERPIGWYLPFAGGDIGINVGCCARRQVEKRPRQSDEYCEL